MHSENFVIYTGLVSKTSWHSVTVTFRRNNFYKRKNDSRVFKKSRNFNVRLNHFKLFFVGKEFTLKYDLVAERSVAASDLSWQRVANNLNDLFLTANDESVKEKLETSW